MRRILGLILAATLLFSPTVALAQNTTAPSSADLALITRIDANGVGTPGAIGVTKVFDSVGVGYSTGSAATQGTSRTTSDAPVINFAVVRSAAS